MIPIRLKDHEFQAAKRAGYAVVPVHRRSSFFGTMFSWVSGIRFGGAVTWPASAESKPPVNAATSSTGQIVSPSTALTLSAVWACVWLNARTLASLPLNLMRYQGQGGKPAENDPLFHVLRWQSNADMNAFNFWTGMWASEQLWGTGYAEKKYNAGKVVALNFLLPQYMTPYRLESGELRYRYDDPRNPKDFAASQLYRVFSRSLDGLTGASVIEFGRNSMGLAQSGELAASKTFKKGLNASGFIKVDKFLRKEQRAEFRTEIDTFTGDGSNAGGTMVLEGGTGYEQLSMKPLDAELLSSRQFSVEDVCRWFGVPPILIGHAAQGQTMWGSGVEQIFSGWLRLGLRPFLTANTQGIRQHLIPPADRLELFAEYDLDDLLAPDSAARAQLYASLAQNGIKTRNELREREGDAPMPGGDELTVQSNLVPLAQLGQAAAGGTAGAGSAAQKLRNALLELLALEESSAEKREG